MSVPLSREKHVAVLKMAAAGKSFRAISEELGVGLGTVSKFAKMPLPPETVTVTPSDGLPEPVGQSFPPHDIQTPGWWLILGDVHLPYFDRSTVELAVAEARKRKAVGVLLNGDILDSHEVSSFDRDPRAARYVEEIETGKQFLGWLRKRLPKAEFHYRAGNHEERCERYIIARAPALFGLEGVNVPSLLKLADLGVEWVQDKRVIALGKLNVIHGHEYRGGVSTPVNPARGVYLKARSVVLCGHFHRTSEHHERNIRGKSEAAWSVGCACALSPRYAPLNNWNAGFALVRLDADGQFEVDNKRVMDGRVV